MKKNKNNHEHAATTSALPAQNTSYPTSDMIKNPNWMEHAPWMNECNGMYSFWLVASDMIGTLLKWRYVHAAANALFAEQEDEK